MNASNLPFGFGIGFSWPMGETWTAYKSGTNHVIKKQWWTRRILWFHFGRQVPIRPAPQQPVRICVTIHVTNSGVKYEPDHPDGFYI